MPPAPGFLLLQSGCEPAPALPPLSEGESEITKSGTAVAVEEACAGWGELGLVRLIDDDSRIIKWRGVLSQRLCRAVGQTLHFYPKLLVIDQMGTYGWRQICLWQSLQRGCRREMRG